jgi:outer membrane protein assembly factor BamB
MVMVKKVYAPARWARTFALLVAALSPGLVAGEDWPEWRGRGRAGLWTETGVLEKFPASGLVVAWRTPVGSAYAGPAVAGGKVFVLDWTRKEGTSTMEGSERLLCLDERTGKVLWTREWPVSYARIMASYAIGPRATPTVDGDRVYVLGAVGDLLAIDAATGEVAWSHDFVEEYDASVPIWGTSSSPLVDGDLLIAVAGAEPDGKIIAYDKKTGAEKWRSVSSDWEMGYEQLVIVEAGGARQLVVWEPRAVLGLDPATGAQYWSESWDVGQGMSVATPVTDGKRLLLSQFYRGSLMLELDAAAPGARKVWAGAAKSEMPGHTDGLHSLITTPILDGDTIYGVCSYGELRALDAATGERLWENKSMTRQGRWGSAFMVRNGDRWFVNNDAGELLIVRFGRDGYQEIDRTKLIEPTTNAGFGPRRMFDAKVNWSHPAYANLHVIARNDKEVLRASLAK